MKVPTRQFGRTEIEMPVLTCGGMRYQQSWDDLSEKEIEKKSQENLEASVHRALELGINHIETARGYGTSEIQLGRVLPTIDRDKIIVQTKVGADGDTQKFVDDFETSMKNLQLEYVDFLAVHGVNNKDIADRTLKKGGFLDAARKLQKDGRVRYIGIATHAGPEIVNPLIETGEFDYVNLHWYFIYHPMHWPMIEAAAKQDMGTLIISPNDKGGKLFEPPEKLKKLCSPIEPMQWNILNCLIQPEVKTLSIGASCPSDYDVHFDAVTRFWDKKEEIVKTINSKIIQSMEEVLGEDWVAHWHEGLPYYKDAPGEINVREVLRLWTYAKGLDMVEFGKMRYNLIGNGGHWFPGLQAKEASKYDWSEALKESPFADLVPSILKEAHEMLHGEAEKRLSESG